MLSIPGETFQPVISARITAPSSVRVLRQRTRHLINLLNDRPIDGLQFPCNRELLGIGTMDLRDAMGLGMLDISPPRLAVE
jgi:hypothetical protein